MYRCIDELSIIDKTLVSLYLQELKYGEIAGILGISEAYVGVKLPRIKKVRAPIMDMTYSAIHGKTMADFVKDLRRQDRKDERYLLRRKILPVLIGLGIIIPLIFLAPLRTPLLASGGSILFASLLSTLILFSVDYWRIGRETFDNSLCDFLEAKEKRLNSWRAMHFKYYITFAAYLIGFILVNLGNLSFFERSGRLPFEIFLPLLTAVLAASFVIGELLYRKRHRRMHEPLLDAIADLKAELGEKTEPAFISFCIIELFSSVPAEPAPLGDNQA